MGSSDDTSYCSFTKAVEHLGDRWSLLIVRELVMFGPQGFNALAAGLPGHVSRSVLADKLRKLGDLGVVTRPGRRGTGRGRYRLTMAGEALVPTVLSLRGWAESWLPDDPAMVERDPDIILGWLAEQVDRAGLPEPAATVAFTMHGDVERRCWIVLERGAEPFGCFEDPLRDESRYVYVEAGTQVALGLARGRRGWAESLRDGSLEAYGDPALVAALPRWFGA